MARSESVSSEKSQSIGFNNEKPLSPFLQSPVSNESHYYGRYNTPNRQESFRLSQSLSFLSPPSNPPPPIVSNEERGSKATISILIPTMLMMTPAIILSLLYHPVMLRKVRQRQFELDDPRISKKYLPESVTSPAMVGITIFIGCLASVCSCLGGPGSIGFGRGYLKQRIFSFLAAVGTLAGFLDILTIVLKTEVAALRPDFLDRCKPDPRTLECTNPINSIVYEGRVSFPSGHASWAMFSCSVFAIMLIQVALGLHNIFSDGRRPYIALAVIIVGTLLSLGSMVPGVFISISRVQDNRHHVRDIVAGMIFGICSAICCCITYWLYANKLISTLRERERAAALRRMRGIGSPEIYISRSADVKTDQNQHREEIESIKTANILALIPSPSLNYRAKDSLSFQLSETSAVQNSRGEYTSGM